MTGSTGGAELAVSVRSRVGEPGSAKDHVAVGVLADHTVVAFPIDPEADFQPVELEAVIGAVPFDAGDPVQRIAGTRVDILAPQGSVGGQPVAFVTLAQPCTVLPDLPEASPSHLLAAIQQTGELWSAVVLVSGRRPESLPELPEHIVQQGNHQEFSWPRPAVRTRVAQSLEGIIDDWCDLTPRC